MNKIGVFLFLLCQTIGAPHLFSQTKTSSKADVETEVQYLSGRGTDDAVQWEFFCTEGRNSGVWTTIPVPSCWELHGFGTYQYGMPFYAKANPPGIALEKGLYKHRFKLPKEWEGRVIRIVFEGVMTDCEALINGRRCGNLHQGAFYRFKSDVSDRLNFGDKENLLEVTVSKESANAAVNLAERRADYWNFGGIFRPVFIEALPALNIDRTAIDAKADGTFYAELFLGSAVDANTRVVAQLTDSKGLKVGKPLEVPVVTGSDKAIIKGKFDNIATWSPETPTLYGVTFSLVNNNTPLHVVQDRIGFRTIEVRSSDGLYINGQKVLVKGVNRHSFRPQSGRTLSKRANYEDVRLIKEMNMNAVRLSHYPSDPDFLDACDELGLYVMVELTGWHGKYDTAVGKKLVKEMIVRDVNHPSVTWWSNGNEGGWNVELDKEFAPLDPQARPVLHPQGNFGGFETMHYRSYGESQEYMRKPEIFMPTEFLHGLYDGGLGAGLWDYWEMMRKHPRSAGGFLWDFADEGVVRTDQNGKIDHAGSYGADGIVGPNHEREGSFYAIKQIWSPVQILETTLSNTFDGTLTVENRYDFTNLSACRFEWKLKTFDPVEKIQATKSVKGINLAPHQKGTLTLDLPADWRAATALYLTAYGPTNEELWTWDWQWEQPKSLSKNRTKEPLNAKESEKEVAVTVGSTQLTFNKASGELSGVKENNRVISFANGPRFIAARRGDRSMDRYYNHDDPSARSKERVYEDISGVSKLTNFKLESTNDSIVIEAKYAGNLRTARWVITSEGAIRLDYEYQYDGIVELMGIMFSYPETNIRSKRWLGEGSYRVWQNRLHGTQFGLWENQYNDPIPGESFTYPEFKGYFANWRWVSLTTTEGVINITNRVSDSFLGVYTPRDGRDAQLYTIPESGISVLNVIPAVRNKVNSTDLVGPSSQAQQVQGIQTGSISFHFKSN